MAQNPNPTPPPAALQRGVAQGTVVAVVVVVALVMLLAGIFVGKTYFAGSSSSQGKTLVVGTNIPFPPFEDFNTTTGKFVGFDIDMAQMIANAANRPLYIVNYNDFNILLQTTGQGGIDMAASAITMSGAIGAERNATMTFSANYYDANQAVLVGASSTLSCVASGCTVAQLKTLNVGVQAGTSSQFWADAYLAPNMTNSATQYQIFTAVDTMITALKAGSLNAVIIDAGPANAIAASSAGTLKVAGSIITGELYAFAVAHGDPEGLVPIINGVISQSMQNGTYNKLLTKWFG